NEIVKEVNENQNAGWTAAFNDRFANSTVAEFKRLLGVKPTPKNEFLGVPVVSHDISLKLPKEFDARTAWSQCSSIGRILESLSDRFCIKYNMNISLSVNDLLACCGFLCGQGCNGGYPISAWRYFKHHGVVTEENEIVKEVNENPNAGWIAAFNDRFANSTDGYFKIKRGTNECGIEHGVVAGLPSDRNVFNGINTSDDVLVSSF
ncbi:hypothetical protein F2Q69_00000015, partial [Brassica cretica]